MGTKKEAIFANVVVGVVSAVVLLAILGIRYWISGPECFFAEDIGVCQAIRDTVGR